MIACDVNVLVYAFNEDAPRHSEYRARLRRSARAAEPFGLASVVASGFLDELRFVHDLVTAHGPYRTPQEAVTAVPA